MHEDVSAVRELCMNRLNMLQLSLVVRAKTDDFNVVRYTAVRANPHSFKTANLSLLDQLKAYTEQPDSSEMIVDNAFF